MSPAGPRERWDDLLAEHLAAGSSYADAAAAAGCSLNTVKRRMRDSAFRGRVTEARVEFAERVRATLLGQAVNAAGILAGLALSANSESVRLAAARSILDYSVGRAAGPGSAETVRLVRAVVEAALRRMDDDAGADLLREIDGLSLAA
jgi:hypothetical protein